MTSNITASKIFYKLKLNAAAVRFHRKIDHFFHFNLFFISNKRKRSLSNIYRKVRVKKEKVAALI